MVIGVLIGCVNRSKGGMAKPMGSRVRLIIAALEDGLIRCVSGC